MNQLYPPAHEKRNFLAFMMEGGIFVFGLAFLNQDGIISVFIDTFTGRMELVGLAVTVRLLFSTAPRLLMGPHVTTIKNLPRFIIGLMVLTRSTPFWVALVLMLSPNSSLIFPVFILAYGILWFGHSLVLVGWLDIFGRVISPPNRGRIQGYQQIIGSFFGISAGILVKKLLTSQTLSSSSAFAWIFVLAGLLCTLSVIPMFFIIDENRPVVQKRMPYKTYFTNLLALYKAKANYRLMIKCMMTNRVALFANPFIILAARNLMGLSSQMTTTIIVLQIIGGLAGGLIWGSISHHLGNRSVILYNALSTTMCLTLVLAGLFLAQTPLAIPLMTLAAFLGGINNLSWLGHINYAIDLGDAHEKTDLTILNGLLTLPVSIAGILIGSLAEHLGFNLMFVFVFVISLITIHYSFRLPEPRGQA